MAVDESDLKVEKRIIPKTELKGKKGDYFRKRAETAKHMKSFTDSTGRIYTACQECEEKDTCRRFSERSGCMIGKLRSDLKQYL